jgi:RNA polymerase sigma-70 factor (ECF subfamily)
MGFLSEVPLEDRFGPLEVFQNGFGCIPNLVRAQSLLPRLIEAHGIKERAIRLHDGALSRIQREHILLCVAASRLDAYCASLDGNILRNLGAADIQIKSLLKDHRSAHLSAADACLLDFCLKLSSNPTSVGSEDADLLRQHEFQDEAIIEAIATTGLAMYRCTLSTGLGPELDFETPGLPREVGAGTPLSRRNTHSTPDPKRPYVRAPYLSRESFPPFAIFQKTHGFIPNVFRAQTLRPDLIAAEIHSMAPVLMPEDFLKRSQKECILLAVSAANLNSYCVAAHCNILRGLGMPAEEGDQIAADHHQSALPDKDKAMLDFAVKLGARFSDFSRADILQLQALGFTDQQILECIAVTALNNFTNTVQMGLGAAPDFEPPLVFEKNKLHLPPVEGRLMAGECAVRSSTTAAFDAEVGLAAEARAGNLDAFEELIRRNSQPVYRALVSILGSQDDAQDAMQDVLLSAFRYISRFQGRSKFSTWLVSIARNTAFQRLRERRNDESLDEGILDEDHDYRPRQVRAWQDNPEQQYAQSEVKELVEKGIMGLPRKYRVVVMMRDIEQLSTDEVARQLGLTVPAVKVRLLRGRVMLREWLSPHFAKDAREVAP